MTWNLNSLSSGSVETSTEVGSSVEGSIDGSVVGCDVGIILIRLFVWSVCIALRNKKNDRNENSNYNKR